MYALLFALMAALQPAEAAGAPAVLPPPSPSGASYNIPYRLAKTKHLLVRARLNGKGPFNFLIDTGAPALFVSTEMAQKAGVQPTPDSWATFDRLEIEGGAVLANVQGRVQEPYQLTGMNAMGLAGARIDGVFGFNLLSQFRIEIDLTRSTMRWTRLDNTAPTLTSLPPAENRPPSSAAQGLAQMEGLTKMFGALMQRAAEDPAVPRGFFGLELADGAAGVAVRAVLPGGSAEAAGVKAGDRIAAVTTPGQALKKVHAAREVLRLTAKVAAGQSVRFRILRGTRPLELSVQASEGGL